MTIKIHGGTARAGDSPLCATCRHAVIVRGLALDDSILECRQLDSAHNRITFPVTFCTGYSDRREPSVHEMEEIAWLLRSDPKRKEIGFVRSSELKRSDRWYFPDEE